MRLKCIGLWLVFAAIPSGLIEGQVLAGEDQQSIDTRRKNAEEIVRQHTKMRTLYYRMRSFLTPSRALSELSDFQRKYVEGETNLTAKLASNPADTNLVAQLNEVRLDYSLYIAMKQEVALRMFQQYTASNALANVAEPDLRAALLATTNELSASQRSLLQEMATPEATAKRKKLLSENWAHLVQIYRGSQTNVIKDLAPVEPSTSSQEQKPATGTGSSPSTGKSILFPLPKAD